MAISPATPQKWSQKPKNRPYKPYRSQKGRTDTDEGASIFAGATRPGPANTAAVSSGHPPRQRPPWGGMGGSNLERLGAAIRSGHLQRQPTAALLPPNCGGAAELLHQQLLQQALESRLDNENGQPLLTAQTMKKIAPGCSSSAPGGLLILTRYAAVPARLSILTRFPERNTKCAHPTPVYLLHKSTRLERSEAGPNTKGRGTRPGGSPLRCPPIWPYTLISSDDMNCKPDNG